MSVVRTLHITIHERFIKLHPVKNNVSICFQYYIKGEKQNLKFKFLFMKLQKNI